MKTPKQVYRRSLLQAGLAGSAIAALGGAGVWLTRRFGAKPSEHPLGERFRYNLDTYRHTDPSLLRFEEAGSFTTGFKQARALAPNDSGEIGIVGDRAWKVFDTSGELRREHPLQDLPRSLACLSGARWLVGYRDRIQLFNDNGKETLLSPELGARTWITGIAELNDSIYLADAGNRRILQCDQTLAPIAEFGPRDDSAGRPGFIVPSPYFDLTVQDGNLVVANPGRHRVERYRPDGTFLGAWGAPGMAIDGFAGCCNPAHLASLPDGRIVTSEKGLNRVKLFTADGRFEGVVAGADLLVRDPDQTKRVGDDGAGFGMPIVADAQGRVLLLDPPQGRLRRFVPLNA